MSTDEIVKAALAEVLASPKWRDMGGLGEDTIYGDLALDVAKAATAAKWQPIETAPRDGTPVLVFSPHEPLNEPTNVIVAKWESMGPDNSWWSYCELVLNDISGWVEPAPTHWMPLPSPPEVGK